jgi:hypothetical protein
MPRPPLSEQRPLPATYSNNVDAVIGGLWKESLDRSDEDL